MTVKILRDCGYRTQQRHYPCDVPGFGLGSRQRNRCSYTRTIFTSCRPQKYGTKDQNFPTRPAISFLTIFHRRNGGKWGKTWKTWGE